MNKINGYTEEEARDLVEYIYEGKKKGKSLSGLFASYGESHGRAKGSIRNYYYTFMRNSSDERVKKILAGKNLCVEKIKPFSDEETEKALKSILEEKSKGISVRKAIFNVSGGDDKLMLRLQNKYRNVLKNQPEKLSEIANEIGVNTDFCRKKFLQKRLESEINSLYERLTKDLKHANAILTEENFNLKKENDALKRRLSFKKL